MAPTVMEMAMEMAMMMAKAMAIVVIGLEWLVTTA